MYFKTIRFILFVSLSFSFHSVQSQELPIKANVNLGIGIPLLDNGVSYHVGVNPFYRIAPHVSIEGQLSFATARITRSFLSGNKKIEHTVNALVGPRLFITKEGNSFRPYLNFLTGLTYIKTRGDAKSTDAVDFPGFSFGVFANIKKILVGISLESPGNLLFKVGYIF